MIEENRLGRMVKVYKKMTDSEKKEIFLERIIEENKGFIYKIVSQYYCDKFEPEELYNEAVSALIESIKYYNPNYISKDGKKKSKVSFYFYKFIDGRMKNYVRINGCDIHTDFHAYLNYLTYKETVYKMIEDNLGIKPTDKELLKYFINHNMLYEINSSTKTSWNEEKIKLMKQIDVQNDHLYYNNPINIDGSDEFLETIEDNTIESPDELAKINSDRDLFNKLCYDFCKKGKNVRVLDIIKLRYGFLDSYLINLINQTIKKVGIEKFGEVANNEPLTLEQISYIYGITGENARVLSDIGIRQLQILSGTTPQIEIKEEHRFPFLNRDLDIRPRQLNNIEFVNYDSDIIDINSKNAYISAKKQGETDLVILDHVNDRKITYHIKVIPKIKKNISNRHSTKKLVIRKENNNE